MSWTGEKVSAQALFAVSRSSTAVKILLVSLLPPRELAGEGGVETAFVSLHLVHLDQCRDSR